MSKTRHLRSNAISRRRQSADELLLWVLDGDGAPMPDWTGKAARLVGGRGVHLRPSADSIVDAVKRGVFRRAWGSDLKRESEGELLERLRDTALNTLNQRVGLAVRAGALSVGQASSSEAMAKSRRHGLLFIAADASEGNQQKFARNGVRKGASVVTLRSGTDLGAPTGRGFVSVAWVDEGAFVNPLKRACSALLGLPDSIILGYESGAAASAVQTGAPSGHAPVIGVTEDLDAESSSGQ
jgi:predicted RNA-binding protein YlxR (DUF448 family)